MGHLFSRAAITLAILLGLGGCANQNVKGAYPSPAPKFVEGGALAGAYGATIGGFSSSSGASAGLLAGAIFGAPLGSYGDSQGLKKALQDDGVTVIELGDILQLVIPADLLFIGGENLLLREAYPTMDQVVSLIKQYDPVTITVNGYSDNIGDRFTRLDRSRYQAQSVTTYLWSRGLNLARFDFEGLGQTETVASDKTYMGSSYNRRIVISLRRRSKPSPTRILTAWRQQSKWKLNSDNKDDF